ncbi:MAG TPA: glycosyltransferase family 2 protein [Ohtaekwangia sp.]
MIELVLFSFFAVNTFYVLVLSIGGHFYRRKQVPESTSFKKIAVFVPCYKEDKIIAHTAKQLLTQNYPKAYFDVIVLADSLKADTLEELKKLDITLIPIFLEKSMKSRSINYAVSVLPHEYDIAIVVDADNILAPGFLQDINNLNQAGIDIVQTQRVAKNSGTSMAVLDGISEAINNHLFRQGSNALGLSSALIGSGMAFPYHILKEELAKIDTPVEDKALQIALVEKGYYIHYRKGTLVFDEKVESPEAYKNQRRRWIAGQYQMLVKHFFNGIRLLFKGNINYFNIAVCHNLFPSRINSLILLFILAPVLTFVFYASPVIYIRWWAVLLLYIAALLLAVPRSYYSRKMLQAIFLMPAIVLKTIQAILQSKNANKQFIHTEHNTTDIDSNLIHKP